MATVLDRFTPEEIVLVASAIAISICEDLSNEDATRLALFISNVSSSMGLFVDARARAAASPEDKPGLL